MEVSSQSYRPLKSWRKEGLNLDICEINRSFKTKRPKLSEMPLRDILIEEERYGVSGKQGKFRKQMEDSFKVVTELNNDSLIHAFAIFDGHSGAEASAFASENLIKNIRETDEAGIAKAFHETDNLFCRKNPNKGGTTVGLAVLDHTDLITANIGDTKIVIIRKDNFEVLSFDHIASDKSEQCRIETAGGFIANSHSTLRVCGQLAITRSIGDARYKNYIISVPYFQVTRLTIDDLLLVIASDGLFETFSPNDVVEIVREKQDFKASEIAEVLTEEAINAGSKDNITVMVVKLQEFFILASSQTDRNKKKSFKF